MNELTDGAVCSMDAVTGAGSRSISEIPAQIPIMLPGVVATATYWFLLCWSEALFALAFLTQTEMKTMPLALYAFFGEYTTEWGQVMAASALITLPTLLRFLPLQTKRTAGLAAGSVKQ